MSDLRQNNVENSSARHSDLNAYLQQLESWTEMPLRYGENPHQKAAFHGAFDKLFKQHGGRKLSFSNLVDIDAGLNLLSEFEGPTFAIIKHTNACGFATRSNITEAYKTALSSDPVSAYGGILLANRPVERDTAEAISNLFFHALLAPSYSVEALNILAEDKMRIILEQCRPFVPQKYHLRTVLNGLLITETDLITETRKDMRLVTERQPNPEQFTDLEMACKLVKHTKTSAIALTYKQQLIASGIGETSRVDALWEAIKKAEGFGFDIERCVMASEGALPFIDSVKIAYNAGIRVIAQPGGSPYDKEIIDFCNKNEMAMVFTGTRHFKH